MYFSKYNIFSKIQDSDSSYIVNLLTGNADILTPDIAAEVAKGNYPDRDEFIAKGYLIDEKEERRLYNEKYLDHLDEKAKDEVQIFFVPWYSCNFDCSYCYQSGYENDTSKLSTEIIDAFFNTIKTKFAGKRKYITLFGGEPLLTGESNKKIIAYFVDKATEANLDVAVVTNGYALQEYMDVLKTHRIREVQVTLDGVGIAHNTRRYLKGGQGTFDKIADGVDLALKNNITINLRMVVDKLNIEELPALARFAIDRGWTQSPFFKTQLGRNYELHYCQTGNEKILSRLEFYEYIYKLVKQYPHIVEFHKPAFSITKFLFENGELPSPLFDACTGCKTEWAFDYSGHIFACTATVGKPGESLGTFYPAYTLDDEKVTEWEERDVTTIAECTNCSKQLACGGGCAAVAFNRTGKLHSPDCRPIHELIGMGISFYHTEEA